MMPISPEILTRSRLRHGKSWTLNTAQTRGETSWLWRPLFENDGGNGDLGDRPYEAGIARGKPRPEIFRERRTGCPFRDSENLSAHAPGLESERNLLVSDRGRPG